MGLDQMYLTILEQPIRRISKELKAVYLREFHSIIGVIVVLAAPLSVNALASMTNLRVQNVEKRVATLRSVLSYSGERQVPVRPLHLSFRDFLLRTESQFSVNERKVHSDLASSCFRIMGSLKRNICGLATTGTERPAVDSKIIGDKISPELQYACHFWAHHVKNCLDPKAFEEEVTSFLETHALHWLEAMTLLGNLGESIGVLNTIISIFQGSDKASKLTELLLDCKRLIARNMEGVDVAPLQLYISALIFAPQNSRVRTLFQHEVPRTISRLPIVDLDWGPILHTLDECGFYILQFSPDGEYLATSAAYQINLWNTTTWELQQTLKCASWVNCVAFAPHSNSLATGLLDGSVVIWDTVKWKEKCRQSYDASVESIAFSCEDVLAMGFESRTRASDISLALDYLDVSHGAIYSDTRLKFSPRGDLLVAMCQKEINVWETENWGLARCLPFTAIDFYFSPGGDFLLINEGAKIIFLETEDWTAVREASVVAYDSVSLSHDGCLLAAAANRNCVDIISLRDPDSRTYLKGHGKNVSRVSFSPTGDILASLAEDDKVKVWNTPADILSYTPQDTPHKGLVFQVMISPSGGYAASHSARDLKIWHVQEGEVKSSRSLGTKGYWDGDHILDFSPDGHCVLSWGGQKPMRIWNTTTGVIELEDETLGPSENNVSFNEKGVLITYDKEDEKLLTQFRPKLGPCEVEARLRVEESWIVEAASGERIMWLPQEYRPEIWGENDHLACDVYDCTVVWGSGSGNVYFMEVGPDTHLQVNG